MVFRRVSRRPFGCSQSTPCLFKAIVQFREFLDIAEFSQCLHPTCRLVHKQHPVSNLQQYQVVPPAHRVPGMHLQQTLWPARAGKKTTPTSNAPSNQEEQADDDSKCQKHTNDFAASPIEHRN